ncbi:hypothetical protein TWF730_008834 [Orbilia blumenaviensis]|uniref:Uncharacterized protein n=1 Tax=Orbilia blumenaviensis TaxID=1796055 RepID=A0AAV9V5W6_9PEZI
MDRKDRPDHGVSSIRFNPHNSSLFSTTSYSSTLSLFSITPSSSSPFLLQTYPLSTHLYTHSTSSVSTTTAQIAVAGSSPHIRLIDPRTSSTSQTLFGHISSVLSIAWSPIYASILASGGQDGSVRIWDIRYGATCLGSFDADGLPRAANRGAGRAHDGGVNGLVWCEDGRRIVSAGMDGKIRVWEVERGMNTGVVFPPVVRNRYQAEFSMVITEGGGGDDGGSGGGEMLWVAGGEEQQQQVLGFELESGRMVKRVGVPMVEKKKMRGRGRITGLVKRGAGGGEFFTCHALGDNYNTKGSAGDGREGIARWRARWLSEGDDDQDEVEVEKTEKQRRLADIFEKATRGPVRYA